jgi:hypothetical protein
MENEEDGVLGVIIFGRYGREWGMGKNEVDGGWRKL